MTDTVKVKCRFTSEHDDDFSGTSRWEMFHVRERGSLDAEEAVGELCRMRYGDTVHPFRSETRWQVDFGEDTDASVRVEIQEPAELVGIYVVDMDLFIRITRARRLEEGSPS